MLRDILRFEWRYHTRQISFIAAAALFFFFGFTVTSTGFGPDNIHINSPYSIAQSIGMLSLMSVFILAVFCANAVVRDRETQMEEIVYTTSVGKVPFLLGRFTGSFLAAFTAFSTSTLGMLAGRFVPWHDPDRLGAVNPVHYLWALLVIALPNMLFAAVVLFALSTVTRSVLASYAGSVLIYVLYFVAAALTNSPMMASAVPGVQENGWLASLLDPFALSAFFEQTRNWTPDLRNTRLVSLTGNFLLNRLLWLGLSVAMLAAVYRLFSFRVIRSAKRGAAPTQATPPVAHESIRPAIRTADVAPSDWSAYLAATKIEIRSFLLTLPFLAILLLWAGLAGTEMLGHISNGEYGSATYPASGVLLSQLYQPLGLLGTILLVYMSAELVWRERTLRMAGVLHATPASNVVFVASKYTTLAALIGAITATGLLTLVGIQLSRNWTIEPLLLMEFAYFLAVPLLLFAFIAVAVQTFSPQKYVGMLIVLLIATVGQFGPFEDSTHPLLRFGWMPDVRYSDMGGFGRIAGFHWFTAYWSAFGALLLLLAIAVWRHGASGLRHLRSLLRRTSGIGRFSAATMAVILIASGAFIFYNTNVLNAYTTDGEMLAWKADYEKNYKHYASLPQPAVTAITANVDLYPSARRYRVKGEYQLTNATTKPIREIVVAVRTDSASSSVTLPNAQSTHDVRFNQYRFTLNTPLQPGAKTTAQYDVTYENPGFTAEQPLDPVIVENGSYIMNVRAFPTIGYRASYEIEDARERQRQGLPLSTAAQVVREFGDHDENENTEWVQFDVTVSTDGDQTAIAPGRLVRAWEHDGRRSFHYRSDTPLPNHFAISSGRFAIAREMHRGVAVEVYYHPAHTYNVARMMRATSESLRVFTDSFGPYPHPHLRLVEVPAEFRRFAGFAQPGVIFFNETRAFLTDARNPQRIDLVYRRVAHEVGHQWWGHQLVAQNGPGASMLVESLTKYAELLAFEKAYGRDQTRKLLTYELDRYLSGRSGQEGEEPPLARVDNESYLYYRKGVLVMAALQDLLGEKALNNALRNLLVEQGGPNHHPTTTDLLRHLYAVAPPAQHALIDQWLNKVVLYNFTLESASSRRLANGQYELTLQAEAAMPTPEQIEVGVYSAEGTQLYLAKHTLRPGAQKIVVAVDGKPDSAAIDPYVLRIDENRFDNSVDVK